MGRATLGLDSGIFGGLMPLAILSLPEWYVPFPVVMIGI
jgi:hypothetical protein